MAQQVFGGHGYIAEHGMEQFVRDARIAMIYEGANGIQALDLVGRKLGKDGGRALMAFFNEVGGYHQGQERRRGDEALSSTPLGVALGHLQQASMWFMQNAHGQARQCRRRLHRLHASLRAGGARLHVGRIAEAAHREAADGERRGAAHDGQARHRALLHGAHAAGDRARISPASRRARRSTMELPDEAF